MVYVGSHDDGATVRLFYTGLKTKDAAKRAALHRFGNGDVSLESAPCEDRVNVALVLYMKLTLSMRDRDVRRPTYISPHRTEKYGRQIAGDISTIAADLNMSEDEAYARYSTGGLHELAPKDYDYMANVPF